MAGSLQNTTLDKKNIKTIPLIYENVLSSFTVFHRTNTTVFLIFFNHTETYTIHFENCSSTKVIS